VNTCLRGEPKLHLSDPRMMRLRKLPGVGPYLNGPPRPKMLVYSLSRGFAHVVYTTKAGGKSSRQLCVSQPPIGVRPSPKRTNAL
jgi:hypothetical protein